MSCTGNGKGDCYAAVWARRVVNNGGVRPSQTTLDAAAAFYEALDTASLLSKIKTLTFFAPDNLIAAQTPFIKTIGNDPWTNTGFVAADLTVNGLKGNGASKHLATGIVPNTGFPNQNSAGLTVYIHTGANENGYEFGAAGQAGNSGTFTLQGSWGDNKAYFQCYGFVGGYISALNTGWTGYLSANRTGANATAIYRAKSTVPHETLVSGVNGSDDTRTSIAVFAFALANQFSLPANWSSKRLSFAAIHLGLSSAESSDFYTAIQNLRTALGGGFV